MSSTTPRTQRESVEVGVDKSSSQQISSQFPTTQGEPVEVRVEESDRDRTRCQTENHEFNENKDKLGWRKKAKSLKDTTTNSRRTSTSWGGERKTQYTTTSITSRST